MKTMKYSLFTFFLLLNFVFSQAQDKSNDFIIPKTSSKATISQTVAATRIEIKYNRPNKKGREIFGSLIPYDQIWRTGADEATEIYFSTPVLLEGNPIDSGKYEIFTIPSKEKWEIILQKSKNQWGSYKYDSTNNVAKFTVTPVSSSTTIETFTISIDQVLSASATLHISWDNVIVPIRLNIDLKTTVIPKLEESLLKGENPPYFHAAMFYFDNDLDINRAYELITLALEKKPEHLGMLYRRALILQKKGDIKEAIVSAEKSMEAAQKVNPELKEEYIRLNTKLIEELKNSKK